MADTDNKPDLTSELDNNPHPIGSRHQVEDVVNGLLKHSKLDSSAFRDYRNNPSFQIGDYNSKGLVEHQNSDGKKSYSFAHDNIYARQDKLIGEVEEAHAHKVAARGTEEFSNMSLVIATPDAIKAGDYPKKLKVKLSQLAQEAEREEIYPQEWKDGGGINNAIPKNPVRVVLQYEKDEQGKENLVRAYAGKLDAHNHSNTSGGIPLTILITDTYEPQKDVMGKVEQSVARYENGLPVVPLNLRNGMNRGGSLTPTTGSPMPQDVDEFLLKIKDKNLAQRDVPRNLEGVSDKVLASALEAVKSGQEPIGAPQKVSGKNTPGGGMSL